MKTVANKTETKKGLCAAERRFKAAIYRLRSIGRANFAKQIHEDVAYHINKIERYGFGFFPNHYVFDDIVALEDIATKLERAQELKNDVRV